MIRQQVKDEYREHRKLLHNLKRVKSLNKKKSTNKESKHKNNISLERSNSISKILPQLRKKKTKKNLSSVNKYFW